MRLTLKEIPEELKKEIVDLALTQFPSEICGLLMMVSGKLTIFPCKNEAGDYGNDFFVLDAAAWAAAEETGEVVGVYHSHPITSCLPSEADKAACKASGVPWLICSPKQNTFSLTHPDEALIPSPILGREFVWGMWDCLGLLTDVYAQEFGIKIPYFDRGLLYEWETDPTWNKFEENILAAGFKVLPGNTPLKRGDVFLMNLRANQINHCAVLMQSNTNIFWHHLMDRLSETGIYGGMWKQFTRKVCRHKDLV